MKSTTEEIAWKYRVVRVADGASDELAQGEFYGWLSELIRKEREEAWGECLSEMPLDLDWKLQYGDQNPYRK